MIIIPVEESLLLVTVDGVISGVEVEDQVLGRLGVSGEELIDQDLGARTSVCRSTRFSRRQRVGGEARVNSGSGLRPAATCSTGSAQASDGR